MKIEPFQLERYFARHEFSAPYLLCCSDCESLRIGDLLKFETDAAQQFNDLWLGYTESQGAVVLRQEIAGLYDGIQPEQVLVHAGAEEAIFNLMNVVLEPGDHVLVHAPYYQSLAQVARAIGCNVMQWPADPDQGWRLDLDFVKERLNPRTRLVVINCPHNPTGFLADRAFLEELVRLSRQHGFVIFSDEVYRFLEYNRQDRLPGICEIDEQGVSLGVMSKSFGLAGLRIGWIVTRNTHLYQKLAAFKDYTTICNSAPSEFLATLALRHRRAIVERNLSLIRSNLDLLDQFFNTYPEWFNWQRPKAGPIAFPGLRGMDVDPFCRRLLAENEVLLLPGTLYGEGYNCFRIGFGRADMPRALEQLEDFVRKL